MEYLNLISEQILHIRGYLTNRGICDKVSPIKNKVAIMGSATHPPLWADLLPESRPGMNNGLTLLVDAEAFDWGTTTADQS